MIGDELPYEAHVVRYVKSSWISNEDGSIDGAAFRLRPNDSGVSVNWLECFSDRTKTQQLNEVRRLSRLKMRKSGCLAELNVGATKQHVVKLTNLHFIHKPLPIEGDHGADSSHSEIRGLPAGDSLLAAMLGEMIAECIEAAHPTVQQANGETTALQDEWDV
jgi:hypothetical protein